MSAFPDPAARLPGEAAFLRAVLSDLSDATRKLVYADWLEEQGDPRGVYLRTAVADPTADGSAFPKPWRDLCGLTLAAEATALGLGEHLETLKRLARPAVVIKAERADESVIPIGASKFGGRPDLPAGYGWPSSGDELLAFLGQFDLSDLTDSPVCWELPAAGRFSVFYGAASLNDGHWDAADLRFLHQPPEAVLTRPGWPDGLADTVRFRPCRLTYTEALSLPDWESNLPKAAGIPDRETYYPLTDYPGMTHQLLGHPNSLQNDVLGHDRTLRHLFTLDSDTDGPGWMWGDAGLLYFTIRAADLAAGRFYPVWVEFQCC